MTLGLKGTQDAYKISNPQKWVLKISMEIAYNDGGEAGTHNLTIAIMNAFQPSYGLFHLKNNNNKMIKTTLTITP